MNAPSRPLVLTATPHRVLAVADERHTPPCLPNPDAELISACAEFDRLERAYIATFTGYEVGSPEEAAAVVMQERCQAEQEPLLDRICDLRATTMAGQVARARSLAIYDPELMNPKGGVNECLVQAIVRDLLDGSAQA